MNEIKKKRVVGYVSSFLKAELNPDDFKRLSPSIEPTVFEFLNKVELGSHKKQARVLAVLIVKDFLIRAGYRWDDTKLIDSFKKNNGIAKLRHQKRKEEKEYLESNEKIILKQRLKFVDQLSLSEILTELNLDLSFEEKVQEKVSSYKEKLKDRSFRDQTYYGVAIFSLFQNLSHITRTSVAEACQSTVLSLRKLSKLLA